MTRKTIFMSNVTRVNGRNISIGKTGKVQKFDERKLENANNVQKIIIDSNVFDVHVSVSASSNVETRFYGEAEIDGNISFKVENVNRELRITSNFEGICYNSNLRLDIIVPQKTFSSITFNSVSSNITIGEGVSANFIKVDSQFGNVKTNATFTNASISTTSGCIELYANAKEDNISFKISTKNGNVSAKFSSIGYLELFTRSITGNVTNHYSSQSGYHANGFIFTKTGDISIR